MDLEKSENIKIALIGCGNWGKNIARNLSEMNALSCIYDPQSNVAKKISNDLGLPNKSLKEIGFKMEVKKLVLHQARLAKKAKLDAIVCSGHEIKYVKGVFKKEIITPGIKIENTKNDQKRVMKPKDAFAAGSHWLVIGRSITKGNVKKNVQNLLEVLED